MPRGGAREGAGRKPLDGKEPMTRTTVLLPEMHLRYLLRMGKDNLSAGVRRVVEEHRAFTRLPR